MLCLYLKIKLKNLNESVVQLNIRFIRFREVLHSYDALYREIDDYNTTYWSKFLINIWLTLGTINVLFSQVLISSTIRLFLWFIMLYSFIFLSFLFITIIMCSASVNSNANQSYKLLNSFFCKQYCNMNMLICMISNC